MDNVRKIIKKVLNENDNTLKGKFISIVDKRGLFFVMKHFKMSYTKLWSIIGDDVITNKVMIGFIKDIIKEYGSFAPSEVDEDAILYNRSEDEVRYIDFFGSSYVTVSVYGGWDGNSFVGEFSVPYYNLDDSSLIAVFDMITGLYDDGDLDRYL